MMKLEDIEKAIKPNFVWMKHPEKLLQTDPAISGHQSAGQIVFIGVALRNGFKRNEIIEYLGIETMDEYNRKLKIWNEEKEKEVSVYKLKFNLTMNNLINHAKKEYVQLRDFKF